MFIYPYKNGSASATALSKGLQALQIKKESSKFRGSPNKLVINWGNSSAPEEVLKCKIINSPEAVALCSNKLSFFNRIKEHNEKCIREHAPLEDYVTIPPFCTRHQDLPDFLFDYGSPVVCRTVLNGHSGEGIVIAETLDDIVEAPLYVKYMKKKSEYRVHVLNGNVVDVQRKARDTKTPDDQVNWKVRNHKNGFVYVRNENNFEVPEQVLTNAVNAVKVVGLDFGAVDIIWNQQMEMCFVLEVNTAPGLQGSTLQGYIDRFGKIIDDFILNRK